jgi:MoxR-like ATPase
MGGAAAIVKAAQDFCGAGTVSKLEAGKMLADSVDRGNVDLDTIRRAVTGSYTGHHMPAPKTAPRQTPPLIDTNDAAAAHKAVTAVATRAEDLALQATQALTNIQQQLIQMQNTMQQIDVDQTRTRAYAETLRLDTASADSALALRVNQAETKAEQSEAAAAAAAFEAEQAIAAAKQIRIDPAEVSRAVTDAVALAFKPFYQAVTETSSQSSVGNMVQARIVARSPCLQVFGIDLKDRQGNPVLVDIWDHPEAPPVDPCFIWSETILRHLILSQDGHEPVWLGGPKGTGKTQSAAQWAARTGRGFTRINFSKYSNPDDYLGATGLTAGQTQFEPQAFLRAYVCPSSVILLDELTAADPGNLAPLNGLLEPNAAVTIGGTVWRKAPGVMILAADNTLTNGDESGGRYAGTRAMNSALADRFARVVQFRYLDMEQEIDAVVNHTACNRKLARHVLNAITLCRAGVDTGEIIDAPSIRSVVAYVRALKLLDPAEAWASTVAARQPGEGQAALEAIRIAAIDESFILKLI